MEKEDNKIAIYHRVMRRENFEKAANDIYNLIKEAQESNPGKLRLLYLDIDGHITDNGVMDEDMFELVSDFLLGNMFKYLTGISCPMYSVTNSNEQINDIPPNLLIGNPKNLRDDTLDELFIENYSNTELVSEDKVYRYLLKFSKFLSKFKEFNIIKNYDGENSNYLLTFWYAYARDLIIEIYNTFIYGNFLSSTAMTRPLIECYAYLSIIVEDNDTFLLEDWYFCSVINSSKNLEFKDQERIKKILKDRCELLNRDYKALEVKFNSGNENKWLESKINKKNITFKDVCKYTKIPNLYNDFQATSSFIHAQDVTSKIMPFTFYESIISKFSQTMFYIFRIIELFPNYKLFTKELKKLENDLYDLVNSY